ncbi:MAG: hypothetical protein IJ552_05520 [Prevotella sp.]|nr:hypothetical protein [Prevotella sp.]
MKKIRHSINLVLSAMIVALGFGSCVSQQKYKEALTEIEQLKGQNANLNAEKDALYNENAKLRGDLEKALDYKKKSEQRKVVYGPRPMEFNEKINQ